MDTCQHKYLPGFSELRKYIDHYWIELAADNLFERKTLFAYPGITPEIIIPIEGYFIMSYQGRSFRLDQSFLFSHLDSRIELNTTHVKSFIIITFKSRSISSILPFLTLSSSELIKTPICKIDVVFHNSLEILSSQLGNKTSSEISVLLDEFFYSNLARDSNGFLLEMMEDENLYTDLKAIMSKTNYSYSTIERYYKKETGLTPKKYQSLFRYKKAVEDIYKTKSSDWSDYVNRYGYYDQSHFIKEIKKYTHFTPKELLVTPGFLSYRPQH